MKKDSSELGYCTQKSVIVTSLLKLVPAYFFIKIVDGSKFGSTCRYSSSLDLDFFLIHLSHIVSSYPR